MSKSAAADAVLEAIAELADEDIDLCLSVVTGHFVGLYTEVIRRQGQDPAKQITIEGGARTITIHAAAPQEQTNGENNI